MNGYTWKTCQPCDIVERVSDGKDLALRTSHRDIAIRTLDKLSPFFWANVAPRN